MIDGRPVAADPLRSFDSLKVALQALGGAVSRVVHRSVRRGLIRRHEADSRRAFDTLRPDMRCDTLVEPLGWYATQDVTLGR